MDFDLSDEQRLLKDSVDRLVADRYDFESRQALRAGARGLQPRRCGAHYAELGLLGAALRRGAWRLRRRRGRDHDRHGGVRARARARALSRDRHPRRRLPAPRRQRGAEGRAHPADRRRRADARLRAHRAAVALRPLRRRDDGASATARAIVLDGEKSVVLHGDSADKLVVTARTAGGAARPRRHRRSSSSTRTRRACRGAATRRRTASAPPRSRSRTSASDRRR